MHHALSASSSRAARRRSPRGRARTSATPRNISSSVWPSRRDVLHAAGSAWVAASALSSLSRATEREAQERKTDDAPARRTGWAVVGLGKLATEEVLPAFAETERCALTALVSGHADKARRLARRHGVDAAHLYDYAGFERLKDDARVDAVYIALPNSMHAEFTIRALHAGKHVLCEKPMATSVEECERMIAAAKSAGKLLMIGYRLHYEPFNRRAMELASSRALGAVHVIESVNYQDVQAPNIRLQKALGGGPAGDLGVYCINAARYLLNEEPVEVLAMHRTRTDDPRFKEVPASTTFQLRYPSGALAVAACGFDGAEARRVRAVCANGWLELDPAFSYRNLRLRTFDGKQLTEPTLEPVDHFAKEMDHLAECITSSKAPRTPGEMGLADQRILAAIERAASGGRAESI